MSSNNRLRHSGALNGHSVPDVQDDLKQAGDEAIAAYRLIEEAWKKAEAKLASCHVPVDVKIEVSRGYLGPDHEPCGQYTNHLCYCKHKGQWRICYSSASVYSCSNGADDEAYEIKPVTDCPVDVRLEMFDFFGKLRNEVVKVTRGYVPRIREAVSQFEETLSVL